MIFYFIIVLYGCTLIILRVRSKISLDFDYISVMQIWNILLFKTTVIAELLRGFWMKKYFKDVLQLYIINSYLFFSEPLALM